MAAPVRAPPPEGLFDNICSLPLPSEVFSLAVHPTQPIFAVGLASGHVYSYRLPQETLSSSSASPEPSFPPSNGTNTAAGKPSALRRTSTSSIASSTASITSTGTSTVSTLWRTRRHKGSCRALAYTTDGASLLSAGTDGLVKIADASTGRVTAKLVIPRISSSTRDAPSSLLALSPRNILVGTDSGRIHIYGIPDPPSSSLKRKSTHQPSHTFAPQPQRTLRPHRTPEDSANSEAISSLTALPPSATSTSGTSRAWISTAGSSVAASDLRKPDASVSIDQGDVLLCSAAAGDSRVVVGSDAGVVSVWRRGEWTDRAARIVVHHGVTVPSSVRGFVDDDAGVECLAVLPRSLTEDMGLAEDVVAAGLANGTIRFVALLETKKGSQPRGQGVGEVSHDEQGFEGCVAIGFDVEGRMISAGGEVVKVWHRKGEEDVGEIDEELDIEVDVDDEENSEDESDVEDEDSDSNEEDEEDDSSDDEKPGRRQPQQKKPKHNAGTHGHHGIMAFSGMD